MVLGEKSVAASAGGHRDEGEVHYVCEKTTHDHCGGRTLSLGLVILWRGAKLGDGVRRFFDNCTGECIPRPDKRSKESVDRFSRERITV
jgi:hypothetical protein